MVKPIRPEDVVEIKKNIIPPEVIEIFNELIAEKWTGKSSVIYQKDAVSRILSRMTVNKDYIFNKHWLDIEDIYIDAGWEVEYDKPGYCESYDANWTFSK